MQKELNTISNSHKNKIKIGADTVAINTIGGIFIAVLAFLALVPFIMVLSGSLSSESAVVTSGYSVFIKKLSFDSYRFLFSQPKQIFDGYKVTIILVAVGTLVSLNIITMTAYVISRKDFESRNKLSFFFYFTTLFNGGMVATYVFMIRYLHLKDTYIALILPHIMNVFYLMTMRSFISITVPPSIVESAKIDGANDFIIYVKVVFPLLKPALASIGLFIFLSYWNDWYNAMLYINTQEKMPIQYVLYKTINAAENYEKVAGLTGISGVTMPAETTKLAMTVLVTFPIVFAYPFVQKYFVKGIMVGAVKG